MPSRNAPPPRIAHLAVDGHELRPAHVVAEWIIRRARAPQAVMRATTFRPAGATMARALHET